MTESTKMQCGTWSSLLYKVSANLYVESLCTGNIACVRVEPKVSDWFPVNFD